MVPVAIAKEWLRIDGTDNDAIVQGLISAAADYVHSVTGLKPEQIAAHPVAETAIKFLLQLWYNPGHQDTAALQRVADNLLKTVTLQVPAETA